MRLGGGVQSWAFETMPSLFLLFIGCWSKIWFPLFSLKLCFHMVTVTVKLDSKRFSLGCSCTVFFLALTLG